MTAFLVPLIGEMNAPRQTGIKVMQKIRIYVIKPKITIHCIKWSGKTIFGRNNEKDAGYRIYFLRYIFHQKKMAGKESQ